MKIAVAVGAATVPAWQGWCIDALRALPGSTTAVAAVEGAPRSRRGPFERFAGAAVAPRTVAVGAGDALGDADLIVDLSGTELRAAAPLGVWSFRLGEADDAWLPFTREIAEGRDTFEVALVRRTGDVREALRSGRFGVTMWYPSTVRLALQEAARWPATLIGALAAGAPAPAAQGTIPAHGAAPSPLGRVRFAAHLAARFAGAVTENLFEVVEWNVGFVEGGARALLAGAPLDVRWLPRPERMTFIADPFVVERDGVRALFVEQFDYERNRGVIDALVLDRADQVVRRVRALDLPTHLSYPYPVEFGGELYIMPENCAANEVALYHCVRFPDVWQREIAIFPAFDGVDTTLFAHGGRWWAFCTSWSHGSNLALHAFHAESPRGPWTAHALNPIVVDVSAARPAGQPFELDGVLYRVGQDCSRSYGSGVAVARVEELTPTAYRETVVRRLDAKAFGRYADGVHTVSFAGDVVVVDGKHVYRDARKLGWVARRARERIRRLIVRRPAAAPSHA